MWDWLDHLKEPVLTAQDLPQMLRHTENPPEGLQTLDKVRCANQLLREGSVHLCRLKRRLVPTWYPDLVPDGGKGHTRVLTLIFRFTPQPHRVCQRITHHVPAHVWGWNPSAIMVAHTHFSVNTMMDTCETHFGAL